MPKLRLKVGPVWAYPMSGPSIVKQALTYKAPGFQHSRAYKRGFWDGNTCLLTATPGMRPVGHETRFPAGLVEYIKAYVARFGYETDIEYTTDGLLDADHVGFAMSPRENVDEAQQDAIERAILNERGIIKFATAYGKTRTMGEFIRRIQMKTVVLCDKADLAKQLRDDLAPVIGAKVGLIGDGVWEEEDCTIAMVQTLKSRLNKPECTAFLTSVRVVVSDEVHHASSDTYGVIMAALYNAVYRIGLSATPFRYNGKGEDLKVIGWFGPVIADVDNMEGVEQGRIVPADIYMISGISDNGWTEDTKKDKFLNYGQALKQAIVGNPWRNAAIMLMVDMLEKRGLITLILVDRDEHGQTLKDLIKCPFIYGKSPKDERTQTMADFRAGKIRTLILSKIGNEGLNVPGIGAVIIAGGGKAAHVTIQKVGRGARASAGKERLLVFDFKDEGKYLGEHAKQRRRTYEADPAYTFVEIAWEELKSWL